MQFDPRALEPVARADMLRRLPPPWPEDHLREDIARQNAAEKRCVVALDDDPTGTQTVHDVWVLTSWSEEDLRFALSSGETCFYILTNSRSLPLDQAKAINAEIAETLAIAAQAEGRKVSLVSRSDSTLRGHFPGEVDALVDAWEQATGESFTGVCIVPFFPEGGRFTVDDVHWVEEEDKWIPASQTPYARDPVFGYEQSILPLWIEEKTGGRTKSDEVVSISLAQLRSGGPHAVAEQVRQLKKGIVLVVNAAAYRDLEVFIRALHEVENKRFLFRSAASLVKVAAGIPDRELLSRDELLQGTAGSHGLIVCGSYVPKSTAQVHAALALPNMCGVEFPVREVINAERRRQVIYEVSSALDQGLEAGQDVLVFTSRERITLQDQNQNLNLGQLISRSLMEVVRRLKQEPRYVIGKGGITSNDLATKALDVRAARVLGQVLPGVPVWRLGQESRWPGVPYVVFPGNVGDEDSLADVIRLLSE
jgi:uncharacterized protein YgbK (DUF1537 family)